MLHIVVGILIVIFAVLAFLNPDENRILFPVIFLLAAVLNLANGYDRYRRGRGRKHLRTGGMVLMAVGAGLFLYVLSVHLQYGGGNKSENRSFANVKRNG